VAGLYAESKENVCATTTFNRGAGFQSNGHTYTLVAIGN
jgi:hypothetical protein